MNVPLACIPIALVLVYAPKIGVSMAMSRRPEGYDNKDPRDQQAKLEGWGRRASAAHANGFEAFPAFAAGAIVASMTNAKPDWAAALAIGHVVARAIYPLLYIGGISTARSLVWLVGLLCSFGLLCLPMFG